MRFTRAAGNDLLFNEHFRYREILRAENATINNNFPQYLNQCSDFLSGQPQKENNNNCKRYTWSDDKNGYYRSEENKIV